MGNLVSTSWLAEHLSDPDILILDASWHLPAAGRNAQAEFTSTRIPGAQFFDLDAISEKNTALPHMLPAPGAFATAVGALGAGDDKQIVCYDTVGLFSAARCWWMFKVFGKDNVSVLDGGLPKWRAEDRPTDSGAAPRPNESHFTPRFRAQMVRALPQVAEALAGASAHIVDARSPSRFRGEEPEPRPGVRPGHMQGAKNIHYATLLNSDGTLKTATELNATFQKAGVDPQSPVIASCGSGVTAAIISLALTELGASNTSLYDGSWAEWGASAQPVVTG